MTTVRVPRLGEAIFEVEIRRWLKQPQDVVAVDEPLVEIETDKASFVLPSPVAGILVAQSVAEGGRASIGAELAIIEERD